MTDKQPYPVRILVVEDETNWRTIHQRNLQRWGYQPVIAEGEGNALLEDAQHKARQYRCHLALVDMRLRDSNAIDDMSGAELVPSLQPTCAIIVTGAPETDPRVYNRAIAAIQTYGAIDFIGKQEDPKELQKRIHDALVEQKILPDNVSVTWPSEAPFEHVVRYTARQPDDPLLPHNQADELVRRMFRDVERQIVLQLIQSVGGEIEPEDTMRRRSYVFITRLDNHAVRLATKIARVDKVEREIKNYNKYVRRGLAGQFLPTLEHSMLLWDIGALVYKLIGNNDANNPNGPRTFRDYYRSTDDIDHLMKPIIHFFGYDNWGNWYRRDVQDLSGSLFQAYNTIWRGKLDDLLEDWRRKRTAPTTRSWLTSLFPRKSTGIQESAIAGHYIKFPDPIAWVDQHKNNTAFLQIREAITHGDLHGNNLFVDRNGSTWPIDFERTGYGPILRDFVELTHDILTRLARIGNTEIAVLYDVVVSLCEPRTHQQRMCLTTRIQEHAEGLKAWQIVSHIRELARQRAQHDDPREYLWGLLLNSLLVATLLEESHPRREKTLLVASIICARLDNWDTEQWPPVDWPPIQWIPDDSSSSDPTSTQHDKPAADNRTDIDNPASNYGAQGTFYGPVYLSEPAPDQKPEQPPEKESE
jgi:DNA-binding response OmpR family regulator